MSEKLDVMDMKTLSARIAHRFSWVLLWNRVVNSPSFRHNVMLFVVNIGTSGMAYLFHPVVGHLLGPNGYGSVVSLSALSVILLFPGTIVTNIANKFAADLTAQGREREISYLLRLGTQYTILSGMIIAAACIALNSFLTSFLRLSSPQPLIIVSLGFIFAFASPLNMGVLQGRQQFEWFGLFSFLGSFLRLSFTVAVLLWGLGINGVLGGGAVAAAIMYGVSLIPLRAVLRGPRLRVESLKPMLVYSAGSALAIGGSTLLMSTDIILAKHFLPPVQAGYYAALTTMGRIALYIGGSLVWVMFPKVAALHAQGRPHGALLAGTMAGVTALSACVVAVFGLFPSQVITLIFHAPTAVADLLFWYGLSMLLYATGSVLMYYFLSIGEMACVPILLACCALQACGIVTWHRDIAQIVTVVLGSMSALLCGMVVLYIVRTVKGRSDHAGSDSGRRPHYAERPTI